MREAVSTWIVSTPSSIKFTCHKGPVNLYKDGDKRKCTKAFRQVIYNDVCTDGLQYSFGMLEFFQLIVLFCNFFLLKGHIIAQIRILAKKRKQLLINKGMNVNRKTTSVMLHDMSDGLGM